MKNPRSSTAILAVTVAAMAASLIGAAAATADTAGKTATPATAANAARGTDPTLISTTRAQPTAATLHTARASVGASHGEDPGQQQGPSPLLLQARHRHHVDGQR